ncbi:hypothetical protein [Pseudophaeobacter sp. EL27]|uniref:hypothetical protein n=1 Tax=Pseudophaeobacter sp. EL27 TaxID=2107580 RepID=UPI001C1FABC9|nr:hypothetical protein [Pseudophaeobacter sp. EL27]
MRFASPFLLTDYHTLLTAACQQRGVSFNQKPEKERQMYSYDWITLVTLGLDRWQQDHPMAVSRTGAHKPAYLIELEAARQRHLAMAASRQDHSLQTAPLTGRRSVILQLFHRVTGRDSHGSGQSSCASEAQADCLSGSGCSSSERAAS